VAECLALCAVFRFGGLSFCETDTDLVAEISAPSLEVS
jgi:hypothetical protein